MEVRDLSGERFNAALDLFAEGHSSGLFSASGDAGATQEAACTFAGTLIGNALRGQYMCRTSDLALGGSWSVQRCE